MPRQKECHTMIFLTGSKFETAQGVVIVYNEQHVRIAVDDVVSFEGEDLIIKRIIPPTRPSGRWAIEVEKAI